MYYTYINLEGKKIKEFERSIISDAEASDLEKDYALISSALEKALEISASEVHVTFSGTSRKASKIWTNFPSETDFKRYYDVPALCNLMGGRVEFTQIEEVHPGYQSGYDVYHLTLRDITP